MDQDATVGLANLICKTNKRALSLADLMDIVRWGGGGGGGGGLGAHNGFNDTKLTNSCGANPELVHRSGLTFRYCCPAEINRLLNFVVLNRAGVAFCLFNVAEFR